MLSAPAEKMRLKPQEKTIQSFKNEEELIQIAWTLTVC
jgi:hypothetical protein